MSFTNSKTYLLFTLIAYSRCLSQTLTFNIDDFSSPGGNGILIFERDAYVPEGTTWALLTNSSASNPDSVGRVLYNEPITFWESGKQLSFDVTLQFRVSARHGDPCCGLTFFIVPAGSITPTGGEGDGHGIFGALTPNSSIFAMDFDVHITQEHGRQIGIVIDSRAPKRSARLDDSIFYHAVTARINYEATTGGISVFATYGSQVHQLSYAYDLKKSLPPQVQIGVSASTRPFTSFSLIQWSFTGTLVADNSLEGTSYIKQYVD